MFNVVVIPILSMLKRNKIFNTLVLGACISKAKSQRHNSIQMQPAQWNLIFIYKKKKGKRKNTKQLITKQKE